MNYTEAKAIADDLVAQVAPYCQRVEIAGSIRRGKAEDIKDVELVVIPHLVPYLDMFQNPTGETFNMLFEDWARHNPVRWIKPGVAELIDWQPKPEANTGAPCWPTAPSWICFSPRPRAGAQSC